MTTKLTLLIVVVYLFKSVNAGRFAYSDDDENSSASSSSDGDSTRIVLLDLDQTLMGFLDMHWPVEQFLAEAQTYSNANNLNYDKNDLQQLYNAHNNYVHYFKPCNRDMIKSLAVNVNYVQHMREGFAKNSIVYLMQDRSLDQYYNKCVYDIDEFARLYFYGNKEFDVLMQKLIASMPKDFWHKNLMSKFRTHLKTSCKEREFARHLIDTNFYATLCNQRAKEVKQMVQLFAELLANFEYVKFQSFFIDRLNMQTEDPDPNSLKLFSFFEFCRFYYD